MSKAFPLNQIISFFADDKLKRGDEISHSFVEAIKGSFKWGVYMYISKLNDIEGAFPRLQDVHIHSLAHPVVA